MSRTVSRGGEVGQRDVAGGGAEDPAKRCCAASRRRPVAVALVLVVLGAGAGIAWTAGAFRSQNSSGTGQGAPPPAMQPVIQENLSSQVPVTATLGYADSYTVQGQGGGTLTWLPTAGQVIGEGQVLCRVDNGTPAALLYGVVPRADPGGGADRGGRDPAESRPGGALGYASSSDISTLGWDYFSWETAYGVQQMESALGVSSPPGSLPLGSVVFEPGGDPGQRMCWATWAALGPGRCWRRPPISTS